MFRARSVAPSQVSEAPVPEDLRWGDLRKSREFRICMEVLGHLCDPAEPAGARAGARAGASTLPRFPGPDAIGACGF